MTVFPVFFPGLCRIVDTGLCKPVQAAKKSGPGNADWVPNSSLYHDHTQIRYFRKGPNRLCGRSGKKPISRGVNPVGNNERITEENSDIPLQGAKVGSIEDPKNNPPNWKEFLMKTFFRLSALLLSLALVIGCGSGDADSKKGEGGGKTAKGDSGSEKATEAKTPAAEAKDIVDTAVAAGSFETLVAAVKAAELVETLKGEGPFTVFAPTDEAFKKLPEGTLATLLKPESKGDLTGILTYHVVGGKVMAADVVKLKSAKTVQGGEVTIAVEGEKVMIDGATVTKTDIECSNGVIHIIDTVILPKK